MYEIYLIVNQINEKIYVGQTVYGREARWASHLRDARRNPKMILHRAMKRYGANRFTVSHLAYADSIDELDDLEIFWIAKLESKNPRIGYNQTDGGHGFGGLSAEAKERHRLSHLGEAASTYRHDITAEQVGELYDSGLSSVEIRRLLSAAKGTILSRMKESGVKVREPKDRTSPENTPRFRKDASTEEMVSLYKQGLSCEDIAEKFDMYPSGVFQRLRKLGVVRPLKKVNLDEDVVVEMYLSGVSTTDIGRKFNVSGGPVIDVLEANGIPRRKGKTQVGIENRKEKKCSVCQIVKPLDSFNKSRRCVDGRDYTCKPCKSENNKKYPRRSRKGNARTSYSCTEQTSGPPAFPLVEGPSSLSLRTSFVPEASAGEEPPSQMG